MQSESNERISDIKLAEQDRKFLWHPFENKLSSTSIVIDRAEGVFIYDEDGKSYIDLISSWWVNLYGHSNQSIAQAIATQSAKMEHVIFSGFTHKPAITLCQRLSKILPSALKRFFFSDNGSTAVEVALKLAYQYWHNKQDKNRSIFLAFEGGYHGDTWGAMSVGKGSGFYSCFEKSMLPVKLLPYPETWHADISVEEREEQVLSTIKSYLEINHDNVIAFILEPLIQAAGGMRVCRKKFLLDLLLLMKNYQILVIFDEVMTGFGRTGQNFVVDCIPEKLVPDFVCLSKGITGGFMPLALTVMQNYIYESFELSGAKFNHGHSYTANPIACAASLAALDLLFESQNNIIAINEINHWIAENLLLPLGKIIKKIRILGTVLAFEISGNPQNSLIAAINIECLNLGLLIRPLGNVIYTIPPYCITESQLKDAYMKLVSVLKSKMFF